MAGRVSALCTLVLVLTGLSVAPADALEDDPTYTIAVGSLVVEGDSFGVVEAFQEIVLWNAWNDKTLVLESSWELLGDLANDGDKVRFDLFALQTDGPSEEWIAYLGEEFPDPQPLLVSDSYSDTVTATTEDDGVLSASIPLDGIQSLLVVLRVMTSDGSTDDDGHEIWESESWGLTIQPGAAMTTTVTPIEVVGAGINCTDSLTPATSAMFVNSNSRIQVQSMERNQCQNPCDEAIHGLGRICKSLDPVDPTASATLTAGGRCDGTKKELLVEVSTSSSTGGSAGPFSWGIDLSLSYNGPLGLWWDYHCDFWYDASATGTWGAGHRVVTAGLDGADQHMCEYDNENRHACTAGPGPNQHSANYGGWGDNGFVEATQHYPSNVHLCVYGDGTASNTGLVASASDRDPGPKCRNISIAYEWVTSTPLLCDPSYPPALCVI